MTSETERAGPAAAPRPRGRRTALTRQQILTAAVAIIDTEGVEALTMRRLGQALDRDPMAIYRHAADKDALLDGVVEHVAAELIIPREPDNNGNRDGDGDWEARLRRIAHTFRRVALAHPTWCRCC
jgi:AcrR family transcriptional regulator